MAAAVGSKRSTSPLAGQEAATSKMQPPVSSTSSKRLKMSRVPEPVQGTSTAAEGSQAANGAPELVQGIPEEGHTAQLPPDGANKTPAKQQVAGEPKAFLRRVTLHSCHLMERTRPLQSSKWLVSQRHS